MEPGRGMAGLVLTSKAPRKAPHRTDWCLLLEAGPWENPMSGILGGAAGNVVYGGTVPPPRNRKGGDGNPPPTDARASAPPDSDSDAAVPVIVATRERFPELLACSFDRGFHSPQNQVALGDRLELNAMPAKGRLSASRSAHEAQPDFALARQQHPAVESAINNLEQRGLDRVRTHGKAGFARTVALSILAANVLRVGFLIRARERARLKFLQRKAA